MAPQETGLYYLQSRYYDPEVGRFLNADILVSSGQGILGNNMFAYCRNNPVRRVDISGAADADCVDDDGEILSSDELEARAGGGGVGFDSMNVGTPSGEVSGGGISAGDILKGLLCATDQLLKSISDALGGILAPCVQALIRTFVSLQVRWYKQIVVQRKSRISLQAI